MSRTDSPADQIQRSILGLAAATVALFLLLLGAGAYGYWSSHKAVTALCTLRSGYDDDIAARAKQVQPTRRFVREHPHGAFGLTQAQLRENVRDSEKQLAVLRGRRKDLSILDC